MDAPVEFKYGAALIQRRVPKDEKNIADERKWDMTKEMEAEIRSVFENLIQNEHHDI